MYSEHLFPIVESAVELILVLETKVKITGPTEEEKGRVEQHNSYLTTGLEPHTQVLDQKGMSSFMGLFSSALCPSCFQVVKKVLGCK